MIRMRKLAVLLSLFSLLLSFGMVQSASALRPPDAPRSITASQGKYTDKIRVSWRRVSDATEYSVYTDRGRSLVGTVRRDTSLDVTDVVAGKEYLFWVSASNNAGESSLSSRYATGYTAIATAPPATTTYTLSLDKSGSGTGTISSSPSGIDCGSDCSGSFEDGTLVSLTATVLANSTFSGWSGSCSGTGVCQVTVDTDKSVTATFETSSVDPSDSLILNPIYQLLLKGDDGNIGSFDSSTFSTKHTFGE